MGGGLARPAASAHSNGGEPLGCTLTLEQTRAIWDNGAQGFALNRSPWRPSPDDVVLYRRFAGERLGGLVLLVGTTPELRDLVAEAGGRAVVVDVSSRMFEETTRMLVHHPRADEVWLSTDWCELSQPHGEFDLALADEVWWALSVPRQHELRDRLHEALAPDGLLVTRPRFSDPTRAGADPVPVVSRYLERIAEAEDPVSRRGEMMSWIYDHTANHDLRRLDTERARSLVLEFAARPELAAHSEFLMTVSKRLSLADWTSQPRDDLLGLICERFALIGEGRADDYDASLYPVLALSPA